MKIPLCIQHWEPEFKDIWQMIRAEGNAHGYKEFEGKVRYAKQVYNINLMLSGEAVGKEGGSPLRFYFPDEETMFFILLKAPKYMPRTRMRHAV